MPAEQVPTKQSYSPRDSESGKTLKLLSANMKRCPTCRRTFEDETLQYCRVDGALLAEDSEAPTNLLRQPEQTQSTERLTKTTVRAKARSSPAKYLLFGLIVVALVVIAIVFAYRRVRVTDSSINSIAVLPFENQSRDPESEYLADGLTESIIYRLSQFPNLNVSPRSSVFHYKGKESDALKIGNELGVATVLSGRITQHGDQITISTELTDVRNHKLLWGEQYDRKLSELLATQREIAREIAERLKVKFSVADPRLVNKHYTESNDAYQSYLKGRYYWNKRTRDGYNKAIEHFKAAIDSDPTFALAYTGLADCYNILSSYGLSSPGESFPLGKEAVTRALELDDNLAEAHTSMAYLKYQFEWDWAGGEREFKRAIELNPNYSTAHHWYGLALANMGRWDEAFAELKRAHDLDPLSLVIMASTGWTFYKVGRYDESIAQFQKALEMDQNFGRAHWGIAEPYELKGDYEKAITELQRARQLEDSSLTLALLTEAYARAGQRSESQRLLAELLQQRKSKYVDAYYLAGVYAAFGDREKALRTLEEAYTERSSNIVWLKSDAKFDGLRSDSRYVDLIRRIGLSP
jgi:TolB-like protein/Tfp pilus assembly protein PilF